MKIREACLEDIENNLLNLYQELEEYHYNNRPEIFKKSNIKELKQKLVDKINDIIVIEEKGRIQAFATYTTKDRMSQKVLFIEQVIVDKKSRNKGCLKELINYIKKIAKERECSRIELCCWEFNQNAKEVYEHLGFKTQRTIYELET